MALTRRSFIASSAAFAAAGCASLGEAGGAADAPRLEFGKDGAFTFLQLTDLHLLSRASSSARPRMGAMQLTLIGVKCPVEEVYL